MTLHGTKLGLGSADINHLGNFRFVGATDKSMSRSMVVGAARTVSRLRSTT